MLKMMCYALIFLILCIKGVYFQNTPTAEFYLDSREGATRKLSNDQAEITNYNYIADLPLKFIIHGWTEDANRTHYINMAKAFLKVLNCYVIRVDYSKIAGQNYVYSATSVGTVGNFIGDFLIKFSKQFNMQMNKVHVIGHSLGGQVSGYVGRRVFEMTKEKLYRISALDPAAPLFEHNPDPYRLTKKDAQVVDIVHTDGGVLGIANSAGKVDFFPNGGRRDQPGCYTDEGANLFSYMDNMYCSHQKSYVYYTASILMNIPARKCNSWKDYLNGVCDQNEQVLFGARMPDNTTGNYYFELDIDNDYVQDVLLVSGEQ